MKEVAFLQSTKMAMKLKTNAEWIEWGRRDPLFGVASWANKHADGATPWKEDEFYALGASDWRDFESHWNAYRYTPGTFVEIGCGAGRITNQLSQTFQNGHALDVSEDMIRYARAHVTRGNVEWHLAEGLTIPLGDNTVDAAFSCHVLQHLPSPVVGYAYFREILRTLKPGGSLMVHLPVHIYPAGISSKFAALCDFMHRRLLQPVLAMKSGIQRLRMKRGGIPPMHATSFELSELYNSLVKIGFERVEIIAFPTRSNGALHPFVLATKPNAYPDGPPRPQRL